jgi:dihydrofolate synthase / folylpolyglutamate synthase
VSHAERRRWTASEAERHLRSLELFGMRFGLDRMRRMMTVLGSPERSFRSIHVVGTNGKSSTTRMIAAILARHGLRTGAYLSPHLVSYSERVQIAERDVSPDEFAGALSRAAWAAERVNRTLSEDDHVTQFELITAAGYLAIAEREVQVAVIEAGLGGRYDATSVIDSAVCALTNVGLEHTRWLGPTIKDIAAEKLAVLGHGTTLVLGVEPNPEVLDLARALAAERSAQLVLTAAPCADPSRALPELRALGGFQQRNFALARAVAECYLSSTGARLHEQAVSDAAASTLVPGRMHLLERAPTLLLDGAHNPDAALALARSLPEILAGRALGLVLGVLEDKDAASMLAALLPLCQQAWFTAPPGSRALSPAALESLARQQGFDRASVESQPVRALGQAEAWALGAPAQRVVLATGSIYLVGELMRETMAVQGAERPAPNGESALR